MIFDFREIPRANGGDGLQDTFELFCRDFFDSMGFIIEDHPDRGADGKKDLIISEKRIGILAETNIRWLVSCKHFAHSGKSVSDTHEPDISDRLLSHKCQGFIGFYSTIPATSLTNKLKNGNFQYSIFDKERIESHLLETIKGKKIAQRYIPKSYKNFLVENPLPKSMFQDQKSINCDYCGKDLLLSKSGMFVFLKDYDSDDWIDSASLTQDIYFSCKGKCDRYLQNLFYSKRKLRDSGWDDIANLLHPIWWLQNSFSFLDRSNHPMGNFTDDAYRKIKQIFVRTFPYISRELTSDEKAYVTESDFLDPY